MRALQLASILTLGLGIASGCASEVDDLHDADDEEVDRGDGIIVGKEDGTTFDGLYRWSYADRPYWNNDVPSLQLAGGQYVRSRCYGHDCAHLVPEFGPNQIVRTSGNKSYVRFRSFKRTWIEANEEWLETPVLADSYEIKRTTTGIRLRKTSTTRWFSLAKVTSIQACVASGGAWDAADTPECSCPAVPGSDWSHYNGFFPGLGGCFEIFAANEDACSSSGSYTDDDGTVIGTYCHCPYMTYETQAGCEPI